jgi:hypothetical protein
VIHYSPVTGDVRQEPVRWRPKTVFVMQQIGSPIPDAVVKCRKDADRILAKAGFDTIDAQSRTTGGDFLAKIWNIILGCPVGVAIVHEGITASTLANIFYELGILQSLGRETVVIRVGKPDLPSDFVRTEYVDSGATFETKFRKFVDSLTERADYYVQLAELVDRNPLLAIDYFRRAAVLNGDRELNKRAREVLRASGIGDRAKSSVEELLLKF